MKMTRTDRIMAIMRHPEFQKDYKKYFKTNSQQQETIFNTLCKKWGEDIRLVYVYYLNYEKWKKAKQSIDIYGCGITLQGKPPEDHSSGRYLYLKVDLTKKRNTLKHEFDSMLKELERLGTKPKKKDRAGTKLYHDPWEIYDKVHAQGLNINQIAKQLTGINDNPAYNPDLHRVYKQIDYAYQKALTIMAEIDKQVKNYHH